MLNYFKAFLGYHLGNEEGQGMVEYVLIIALIAIAVIAIMVTMGDTITDKFQEIIDGITGAGSGA